MSSIILDPNDSPIQRPHDKYLDAPMTRREARTLFARLATNDSELMGMADTAAILINYICEKKLNVSRDEVQAYVDMKKAQLDAERNNMKEALARGENPEDNQADGVKNAQSNS